MQNTQETSKTNQDNEQTFEGRLITIPRGFGFIILHEGEENEERVFIPDAEALNTGMHNDTVVVTYRHDPEKGELVGRVTEVKERSQTQFVGSIQRNENSAFLIPDAKKSYKDFYIPISSAGEAKTDDKALVEFVKWDNPNKNPEGKVLKVIGKKGEHETEMRAMALESGFDTSFPDYVEKEADTISREITEDEIAGRRDMREVTTFTIDPETAKDFDDALSYRKLKNGSVEIGIHIADVTHYVKTGMKINDEAVKRATSVYLVDRTIPMLPEVLSNDMCSLMPDVDRLAFSAIFTFSKDSFIGKNDYKIIDEWYGRTVIHSDRRFSYEEAEDVLNADDGEYKNELDSLMALSSILRKERFDSGAIRFETDEIKVELDQDMKPMDIIKKEHLKTHGLIEEYMLLANRKVAKFVTDKIQNSGGKLPFVYRIHDEPDRDRMDDLIPFLRGLEYELKMEKDGTVKSTSINKLLDKVQGSPEERLVNTATIRTMAKAIYSTKNIGHFGLAFLYYTHFTSPIRRYPDMMVHRLLDTYLKDEKPPHKESFYQDMCIHASDREKDAADAERDSVKYKQVEYMQTRIGEKFKGIISGISKSGIFVQEKETLAEGLIRLRELHDDYYTYDEKNYRLVGENKGKEYHLGDIVDIKLINTDLDLKQIDYTIV